MLALTRTRVRRTVTAALLSAGLSVMAAAPAAAFGPACSTPAKVYNLYVDPYSRG